jgi:hypothetical protein
VEYSNFFNSGMIAQVRGGNINNGMLFVDPEFADPDQGDFTLPPGHLLLVSAKDGGAMGDPRWAVHASSLREPVSGLPSSMILDAYPNPANASVSIRYKLETVSTSTLSIYSLKGSLFKSIPLQSMEGTVTVNLDDMHSGVWLFQVSDGNTRLMQKVVVLK